MLMDGKIRGFLKTVPLAAVGLLFLCLCGAGCADRDESGADAGPGPARAREVTVRPVRPEVPGGTLEYVGTLEADQKVDVSSETGGTVERLCFEKGEKVRKGQLLAEINTRSARLRVREARASVAAARNRLAKMEKGSRPEEIRIAEASLAEAEAGLVEAEKHLRRMTRLHGTGAVSENVLDAAVRRVDTARARAASARNRVSLMRQGPRKEDRMAARAKLRHAEAVLLLARDRLKKSMIRAPLSGIIAFRNVEEGEVIPPGRRITRIVDPSRMKISLAVAEKDLRRLKAGARFPFTVDAVRGALFSCRLSFRSPTADPATRSFPVEFRVDKPDPRMADGMTARVRIPA
ncbi:MAG: hypothetical protein DRH56_00375, partial [Deltaproteobacteria bacterium]